MAIIDTLKKILSSYNGQTPSTGKEVEDAFNENFETVKESVNSAYDEIAQLGGELDGNLTTYDLRNLSQYIKELYIVAP